MPWLAVSLDAGTDRAEFLADALLDAGAVSVDIADAAAGSADEKPILGEPGAAPAGAWERNRVTALFALDASLGAVLPLALRAAGMPDATPWRIEPVDDRDWVRATQDQFAPTRVSARLWVVPTWHAPPDPAAVNLVIDPGLAFGTGTHPTTRLVLRWLDASVSGGETVIDYGCGSGILAVAAMKLGAARAFGVDIDAQALLAARHNAMQNQVMAHFIAAEEPIAGPADLVVANIFANPLIVLAPLLAGITKPGGRVALSGIHAGQAEEVRAAYRGWFSMDEAEQEDGWVLLSGTRRTR
jgi:ribosomal protein L11 methyltransferase